VNPRFVKGDLVAIDSHINLFYSPIAIANGTYQWLHESGSIIRDETPLYDNELIAQCCDLAMRLGFPLHRGTYLGTLGPTYETRAEYRAFRTMGADMVGMSTILEMIAASQEGMRTLAFSVITNVANPDQPAKTTHEEVLDVAAVAQARLLPLVVELLSKLNMGL
jgi:purine-nucleoside phosphorylase